MKKLFWIVAVVEILIGCQTDIDSSDNTVNTILIGSTIKTKSTGTSSDADNFKTDEEIYVWGTKDSGSTEYIKAWKLKASDDNGNFYYTGGGYYWPTDLSTMSFQAIHGNFGSTLSENSTLRTATITHTVKTSQTDENSRRISDLLFAEKANVAHCNDVRLEFEHKLSKVVVKLVASGTDSGGQEGVPETELAGATVKMLSVRTTSDCVLYSKSFTTTGTTSTVDLGTVSSDTKETYAILPPQDIALGSNLFEITLPDNGREMQRKFLCNTSQAVSLVAGNEHVFTISLKNHVEFTITVGTWTSESSSRPLSWNDYIVE